jgi:hypothetical protein
VQDGGAGAAAVAAEHRANLADGEEGLHLARRALAREARVALRVVLLKELGAVRRARGRHPRAGGAHLVSEFREVGVRAAASAVVGGGLGLPPACGDPLVVAARATGLLQVTGSLGARMSPWTLAQLHRCTAAPLGDRHSARTELLLLAVSGDVDKVGLRVGEPVRALLGERQPARNTLYASDSGTPQEPHRGCELAGSSKGGRRAVRLCIDLNINSSPYRRCQSIRSSVRIHHS